MNKRGEQMEEAELMDVEQVLLEMAKSEEAGWNFNGYLKRAEYVTSWCKLWR